MWSLDKIWQKMASNLFKLPENNRKDITQQFALSNLSNWCQRRSRSQFECCAEMENDNKSYVGYVERSLDQIWHKMALNLFKLPENNRKDITQQFALSNLSNWCQRRGRSQFECCAEVANANKSILWSAQRCSLLDCWLKPGWCHYSSLGGLQLY